MKILHIISRFTTGGAERLLLGQVRASTDKYSTAIAAVRGDGELLGAFQETGARIVRDVFTFVKAEKPDIVHTHLLSGDTFGYLLKVLHPNIRWVSTQHNIEEHISLLRRMLWHFILQRADAVVAVSEPVADFCMNEWDIPQGKLHVIPNAIPLQTFLAIPPLDDTPPPVWRIASIGRLEKQKGHEVLLAALAACTDLAWRAFVYGEGKEKNRLAALVRAHGLEDRVELKGVVDAGTALHDAQVVVQPSLWEGRSLAVMEAMAAGRCVVASAAAGTGLMEDGKTGVVVATGDVKATTAALRRVMTEPGFAKHAGDAARAYAQHHFRFDAWLQSLDRLYQSL
jgi:glycosyltransferase involved in cell wall biosynthesis